MEWLEGWNAAEVPLVEYNEGRKTVSNPGFPQAMPSPETETIDIVVNGEPRRAPAGLVLEDLLRFLGIDPPRVAVERNRDIVRRPDWNSTTIHSGDRLEIVQFVGGG